ncbi:hypothetical protein [Nonomuraea longicatena]|uniref:Uncharacterized protein n=1 Tax=Nonomuraea longicatena TaxID=83682 RepID=A0ABN1QYD3_9ACTN
MKRRKAIEFHGPGERHVGDCPRWIALMRRNRPELSECTVIVHGRGPWPCWEGC